MARYIDADALTKRLKHFSDWCRDGRKQGVDFVLDCPLPDTPTVDVAPKSEVAREIFAEIDVCLERFINDISYSSGDLIYDLGEIKEKYIGDQTDDNTKRT